MLRFLLPYPGELAGQWSAPCHSLSGPRPASSTGFPEDSDCGKDDSEATRGPRDRLREAVSLVPAARVTEGSWLWGREEI